MRRTVFKLAAFVAVCVFFTGWLAFTIGNIHPFRSSYTLTAAFDDVTGLLPDDNVKVAGVVVGKVRSVAIDRGRAKVTFSVRKGLRLPTDSAAAIRWRNLLGQRYVYLYPGSASTVLRPGARVTRTRSVVDLGELFNRLGPVVAAIDPREVNTFLDAVVGALDGNQAKLSKAIDDLAILANGLASRDQAIGRLVENLDTVAGTIASRDRQIRTVLDNLLEIARTFSANTDTLDQAVTTLGDYSDNLNYLLGRNRTQIADLIASLRAVTDVVKDKQPQLDSLLGGLGDGTLRLFNASRYGDWLNQTIPCGALGYTADHKPQIVAPPICGPTAGANGAVRVRGAAAVAQLLEQGVAR